MCVLFFSELKEKMDSYDVKHGSSYGSVFNTFKEWSSQYHIVTVFPTTTMTTVFQGDNSRRLCFEKVCDDMPRLVKSNIQKSLLLYLQYPITELSH